MRIWIALPTVLSGLACAGSSSEPKVATLTPQKNAADGDVQATQLDVLVEAFFEESLKRNPITATSIGDRRYNHALPNFWSDEFIAGERAFERYWLSRVESEIDRASLTGQSALTYDVFVSQRREAIESEQFPFELIPITQFFSVPSFVAQLGSGRSIQPFANVEDYEAWLMRLRAFVPLMDQLQIRLRQGVAKGVVQPKVLMNKLLPQLEALVVEDLDKNIFMMPVKSFPDGIAPDDQKRLRASFEDAVRHDVIPSYRRLHDYIRDEYMASARDTHGYWAHPNGSAWYAFLVKQNTTTDLTPDEIHDLGIAEVERIQSEMREVMSEVGFEGTLKDFFEYAKNEPKFYYDDAEDLLQGYRDLQAKVNERLPKLFDVAPKADYEVRAVEAFREDSAAGASYQRPAPDGSRPGVFYVNTRDLKAQPKFGMETLSIHEASPGHHFQIAIAQEIEAMPRFRRFGGYTAYVEGWALYAESIGKEMGMFDDPMQYYGRLSDELLRAMRLVVDTGMHHKRWTREQAMAFMLENSSMAETDVVAEVERYLAIPGQALAYKVGQLAIRRMRDKAERELGQDFDIKDFHRQVLVDGALPLSVLEAKIDLWIETVRAGA